MHPQKDISPIEAFSDRCTKWIGSSQSLVAHTLLFAVFFVLYFVGVSWSTVLLFLTTIVSLEAIYLAIFIQISINRNTRSLEEVEENIEEIQEDIEEMDEDENGDESESPKSDTNRDIENIHQTLQKLLQEVEQLKQNSK